MNDYLKKIAEPITVTGDSINMDYTTQTSVDDSKIKKVLTVDEKISSVTQSESEQYQISTMEKQQSANYLEPKKIIIKEYKLKK